MPERTLEHCHYTIIAPEGPGRVTPHPILGYVGLRTGCGWYAHRTQYRWLVVWI